MTDNTVTARAADRILAPHEMQQIEARHGTAGLLMNDSWNDMARQAHEDRGLLLAAMRKAIAEGTAARPRRMIDCGPATGKIDRDHIICHSWVRKWHRGENLPALLVLYLSDKTVRRIPCIPFRDGVDCEAIVDAIEGRDGL